MDMDHHAHAPVKAVHNMVVVGEHRIFLSHLPMFMAPHDSQVILEAHFVKQGRSLDEVYFADRAANRTVGFYTLSPEAFSLQELLPGVPGRPQRAHFKATVFRGHLEKQGPPIAALTDIDVQVKGVVHAHSFTDSDKLTTLSYFMFGDGPDLFLAHSISKPPDFDQILSISATGSLPTAEELRRGAIVDVAGRGNSVKDRLKTGETIPARRRTADAHQVLNLNVTVRAELYFEEGELSAATFSDKMMDTTKEEKKAGFP